ncbi:uncharacterized protein RAG0_13026 [Rhynchosporium agropyri]|uniref:Uncharacterized protein n=1 Tax=Rhynchosporium agropyri TaxID=914238 RepID=A0A1E1LAP7_9HELO|nr:uncharacterized protein RAG0_13026 [Rhynchosporium agropyri]
MDAKTNGDFRSGRSTSEAGSGKRTLSSDFVSVLQLKEDKIAAWSASLSSNKYAVKLSTTLMLANYGLMHEVDTVRWSTLPGDRNGLRDPL